MIWVLFNEWIIYEEIYDILESNLQVFQSLCENRSEKIIDATGFLTNFSNTIDDLCFRPSVLIAKSQWSGLVTEKA